MIIDVRNIVSSNPSVEVWKSLRLYLNPERAAKRIREIHKIPQGEQRQNISKQCAQIGYSIRQGEEFFRAASAVGLATKPLLVYYGCVALSRALTLMKRDGNYSLDMLRKAKKHRHHGLVLNEGEAEKAAKAKTAAEFFGSIRCSCFLKEDGTPWGQFPLFYDSLSPSVFIVHLVIRESDRESYLERDLPQTCADALRIEQLKSFELQTLELLRSLPDLFRDLIALGIGTDLARGGVRQEYVQHFTYIPSPTQAGDTQGNATAPTRKLAQIIDTHDFFINGLVEPKKTTFFDFLRKKNEKIVRIGDFPSNMHLRLTISGQNPKEIVSGYYPDIVDDVDGDKFYILKPETYVQEAGALYAIMFCLGMLSRYYPDLWMTTLTKNIDVVEVTNTLLEVVIRKFPNLILDQISGIKHFIHL